MIAPTITQFLLTAWTVNSPVLWISAVALGLYSVLFMKQPTPKPWLKGIYFLVALALLWVTFASPVHELANGYLFSAHVAQHILLVLIIPLFFCLSLPHTVHAPRVHPIVGWLSGIGAMWFWHVPAFCNAAVTSQVVYTVQSISLLVLGTFFWWPLLHPQVSSRISPLAGVAYLFTACTACSMLGILLTFAPVSVCSIYQHPVDRLGILNTIQNQWGLTSDRDQQLGGLLMWIPMCMIYLCAVCAQLLLWYRSDETVPVATTL